MRVVYFSVVTTLALIITTILPSELFAGHAEPARAKKASFNLVNSYFRCDSPNTNTQSGSLDQACTPAVPWEFCALTSDGSGKLIISVTGNLANGTQDVTVTAVANGLNALCEGSELCAFFAYRATTDDCAEGSCTTVDVGSLDNGFRYLAPPGGCCTVTDGKCKIKTTISAALPGVFTNGLNTGIELLGCGLRPGFPLIAGPVVSCGVLLK